MKNRKKIVVSSIASGVIAAMLLMPGLSAAQVGGAEGAGGPGTMNQTTGQATTNQVAGTGMSGTNVGTGMSQTGPATTGSAAQAPTGTQPGNFGQTNPTGIQSPLGTEQQSQQNNGPNAGTNAPQPGNMGVNPSSPQIGVGTGLNGQQNAGTNLNGQQNSSAGTMLNGQPNAAQPGMNGAPTNNSAQPGTGAPGNLSQPGTGMPGNVGQPGTGTPGNVSQPGLPSQGNLSGSGQAGAMGSSMPTFTLANAVTINGVQLPAGDELRIVGVPDDASVPLDTSAATLPSGTMVVVPSHPDLGVVTLDSDMAQQITGQLGGPLNSGMLGQPDVNTEMSGNDQSQSSFGQPGLNGEALGFINLGAPMVLAGVQLPMGQPLQIMGLPTGFELPNAGPVTLPAGTMVSVPGRPDLGTFALESPVTSDVTGVISGATTPTEETMAGPEEASVAGVQVTAPANENVFQPGGLQLQVRQIPSTGGVPMSVIALGLSLLLGAGLTLRHLGKR